MSLPSEKPLQCPICQGTSFIRIAERILVGFDLRGDRPCSVEVPVRADSALCLGNGQTPPHRIDNLAKVVRAQQESMYLDYKAKSAAEAELSRQRQKEQEAEFKVRAAEAKQQREQVERDEEVKRKKLVVEQNERLRTTACQNAQASVERRRAFREFRDGIVERA